MSDDAKPAPRLKVVPISSKAKEEPWSPVGMLKELIADIESGKCEMPAKMLVLWFSEDAAGSLRPHRWYANTCRTEELALLELGKHLAIEDWRN